MAASKKLCILLQIMLISSAINEAVSVDIPNLPQLRKLVHDYLIPDFQELVLNEQFAVAIFQPGNAWDLFEYKPSANNDGWKPVIDRNYQLSPPNRATYNNYLAARPHNGVHSEIQILDRLDELYNEYVRQSNGNRPPQALLLYSWIVPCKSKCTPRIVQTFTRAPFRDIPVKVVAHTTNGGNACGSDCDVNYTRNELRKAGIGYVQVHYNPLKLEDLIDILNEFFNE